MTNVSSIVQIMNPDLVLIVVGIGVGVGRRAEDVCVAVVDVSLEVELGKGLVVAKAARERVAHLKQRVHFREPDFRGMEELSHYLFEN
jgi:hypothetical protein